ncbi:MAG: ABC transporter substrate-binding protein [Deltaproteobacteria bacterium]|nr:ABC transporter substrate-binding protein [Deltaproteobacteria bacterium]
MREFKTISQEKIRPKNSGPATFWPESSRSRLAYFQWFLTLALGFLLLGAEETRAQAPPKLDPPVKARLGLLPIADTILLRLAQREGYFTARGLEVELIPFQSSMEKDAAVLAGQLSGHFCEISSAMTQRAQGHPYRVIATTSHTDPQRRFFGLVTKPGSPAQTLTDLQGQTLGVARQTIVDFLADIFLDRAGLPRDYLRRRDIRKIPLRLQTLKAGRLETSIFPEPLLSLAELAGGRVLVDDRDLNMPLAVVALRDDLATEPVVRAFRGALSQAVGYANAKPAQVRALSLELGLISPQLAESWLPPTYDPQLIPNRLPDKALFEAYVDWLVRNGVLRRPGSPGTSREAPTYSATIFQEPS